MNLWKGKRNSADLRAYWIIALVTVTLALLGLSAPELILQGYFAAYVATLNVVLGALAIILIAKLSGAHWIDWLVVPLRSAIATLPVLALLSIPLCFNVSFFQPWVADTDMLRPSAAQRWMQPSWILARDIFILIVWLLIGFSIRIWSRQSLLLRIPRVVISLIALVLTVSIFSVDWIMGLIEFYTTTMIGFLLFSEQIVAALAIGALWLTSRKHFHPEAGRVVGNLLLAAVMFHGYCLIMDFIIVWEANLPHEISGYLQRHGYLMPFVILFLLVVPLVALLFRSIKTNAKGLAMVAGSVIFGHVLMVCWLMSPLLGNQKFDFAGFFCAGLFLANWVWGFYRLCHLFGSFKEERIS